VHRQDARGQIAARGPNDEKIQERRFNMDKLLIALALTAALATPALAAIQKAEPRPEHRHVASIFKPQWKGVEQSSRSASDYWQPCNSTLHAYIVNNCD
jgi:hypothetical protein